MHYPNSSYMGPGTHLHERLKRGDKPKTGSDFTSMLHDLDYNNADGNPDKIRIADEKMLHRIKPKIAKEPLYALPGYIGISAKKFIEDAIGYDNSLKVFGHKHAGRKGSAKKILNKAIHHPKSI